LKPILTAALSLLLASSPVAAEELTLPKPRPPLSHFPAEGKWIPPVSAAAGVIPGLGHLVLGEPQLAAFSLGAVAAPLLVGALDQPPRAFTLVDYAFMPAWGLQLHEAHQVAREKIGNAGYAQPLVRQSPWELFIAPFQWEQLSDGRIWSTLGWDLLGALVFTLLLPLETSASATDFGPMIMDAKSAELWGITMTPGHAYLANVAVGPLVYAGVGAWEEATFRGVIQNELERPLGPVGGAWAAGTLFSLSHRPTSFGQFATRAWGGYLLGRLYQESGYDLKKAVAAHAYWDTLLMPVLALLPGRYNPLGFRFTF